MELHEFENKALKTAIYSPEHSVTYPILGLIGEAGELANKYKKVLRDHNGEIDLETRRELINELGDVLWYVAAVANDLACPLEVVATNVLQKLQDRQERGVVGGSGDAR